MYGVRGGGVRGGGVCGVRGGGVWCEGVVVFVG